MLHAAASCGNVGIMQSLLDRGLSPRDTDRVRTALATFSACAACSLHNPFCWRRRLCVVLYISADETFVDRAFCCHKYYLAYPIGYKVNLLFILSRLACSFVL